MSDNCHRPTLTFPDKAYNATQVRLYGIAAKDLTVPPTGSMRVKSRDGSIIVETFLNVEDPRKDAIANEIDKLRESNLPEAEIYRRVSNTEFDYPRKSAQSSRAAASVAGYLNFLEIDTRTKAGIVALLATTPDNAEPITCGIIVGYAYEGHCYDLPKPKIMLIPAVPQLMPKDDCYEEKYDKNASDKYMLWIVDKLDECVEFEMNRGFVEQIVLDANLPGKRSPTMYASKMMMSHRGGKLNE